MAKLIEFENAERDYGMTGVNAIVDVGGKRLLICDAFGGIDSLDGGAVRWRHGIMIQLQSRDTLESLRAGEWNESVCLWDAVTHGHDDSRPILAGESIADLAAIAGL